MEKKPQLSILVPLISFASVLAVLFAPALPEMAEIFGVSSEEIQYSMTLYLIGYAVGFLPLGPLAARYGRKPVLYGGLSITIAGTILTLIAGYLGLYWLLLVSRLLQAFGACSGMKVTVTMISDSFDQQESARALSLTMLSFALAPGIAVFIGGWLTEWFGWSSCFYFLTLYALIFLYLATLLPETLVEKSPISAAGIVNGFKVSFTNWILLCSACMMGLGTACVYLYSTAGPFLGIERMHYSPGEYGLLNLIPSIGMLVGGLISAKLSSLLPPIKNLVIALVLIAIGSFWMLFTFASEALIATNLFIPMLIIYLGIGINLPAASSLGLAHSQQKAYASATLNFLNMGMATLTVLLLSIIPIQSIMLLPSLLVLVTVLLALFWASLKIQLTPKQSK
ncbi:MAG: MFS transporter [Simkaniaceae bacterium]|nr:MFS transporter [Simkaniaceae bacterium]